MKDAPFRWKVLCQSQPDYSISLTNLDNLYKDLDDYEKAEQSYLEFNSIRENKLRKKQPLYATSLFSLANLYISMGQYNKAGSL